MIYRRHYPLLATRPTDPRVLFVGPGGHLGAWAAQGVLLLNAVLTVEGGAANSHAGQVRGRPRGGVSATVGFCLGCV
jgi:hypothetical protein